MIGPASCLHGLPEDESWAVDDLVVRWFHHHDVVSPDICALLAMSAVADMSLLNRNPHALLRVAAFFLVFGTLSDLVNFGIANILSRFGGSDSYELWMVNHLHGPGKFFPNSHECNYYIGNWFFRVRAGLALSAWFFSPVLATQQPSSRSGGMGVEVLRAAATLGHIATVAGWALLFAGYPSASFASGFAAVGCWALRPCTIRLHGSEWPAAAPAVALIVLHCGIAPRRSFYDSIFSAARVELSYFFGLSDVWIISYFMFPFLLGGLRFPGPLLWFKDRSTLAPRFGPRAAVWFAVVAHVLAIVAYIVGVVIADPASWLDEQTLLRHEPGLLPHRYNTGWGFSGGSRDHIGIIYLGLPALVVIFMLAVPATETRASRLGLTGSVVSYALHIPILCFQHSFECVRGNFVVSTGLSLVTSLVLLHISLPSWVMRLGGWSMVGEDL